MNALGEVLLLSHTHWRSEFVVGSHHLARELSRLGWRVARVATPLSPLHAVLRRSDAGNSLRHWIGGDEVFVDEFGVMHARPVTLAPAQYSTGSYGRRILARLDLRHPRFVLVDQPLMLAPWVFDLGATVIYRPTDIYLGRSAQRLEQTWLGHVDGVAATSAPVLGHLDLAPDMPSTVIRNGAELSRFAEGSNPWSERDGVVYVGALDHRFDWDALVLTAKRCPDLKFTIAGPVASAPDVPANVTLVGPVPYQDVPAILSSHRVALMPFSNAPENRGRSPMKMYECIASGLHVVVSETLGDLTPELSARCSIYSDREEAGTLVAVAHASPAPDGISHAVAGQDWAAKADELIRFAMQVESGS